MFCDTMDLLMAFYVKLEQIVKKSDIFLLLVFCEISIKKEAKRIIMTFTYMIAMRVMVPKLIYIIWFFKRINFTCFNLKV